eukprot:gene2400-2864_t
MEFSAQLVSPELKEQNFNTIFEGLQTKIAEPDKDNSHEVKIDFDNLNYKVNRIIASNFQEYSCLKKFVKELTKYSFYEDIEFFLCDDTDSYWLDCIHNNKKLKTVTINGMYPGNFLKKSIEYKDMSKVEILNVNFDLFLDDLDMFKKYTSKLINLKEINFAPENCTKGLLYFMEHKHHIESISIQNIELSYLNFKTIFRDCVKNESIKKLSFENSNIGGEEVYFYSISIELLLETTRKLESLILPNDCDSEIFEAIAKGLIKNQSLKHIGFNRSVCKDDKIFKYFLNSINSHPLIEHLSLTNSNFNFVVFSDFLKKSTKLKIIEVSMPFLSHWRLSNIDSLGKNESLEEITLIGLERHHHLHCFRMIQSNKTIIKLKLDFNEYQEFCTEKDFLCLLKVIEESNLEILQFSKENMNNPDKNKLSCLLNQNIQKEIVEGTFWSFNRSEIF